jgi:hypothetical protein
VILHERRANCKLFLLYRATFFEKITIALFRRRELVQAQRETRFLAVRGVLVNDALACGLINLRDGRGKD